jgi:nitrate reductase assembly molybdenum cofactor insertion protein NarJ
VTAPINERVLAEAAEWRLLSLLFDCPGDEWRRQIEQLAGEVHDPELRACAHVALEQAGEGLYHSTLGPGGPAAPREVSYCDALQFGYLMSELRAYYDAFDYHPLTGEAPDHVAVETGFLAFLKLKEAFALASGDPEHADVTREAADRFARDHLSAIATPLAERLAESGLGYLAYAGQALLRRTGPAPLAAVTTSGGLRLLNEDTTVSCGDPAPDQRKELV